MARKVPRPVLKQLFDRYMGGWVVTPYGRKRRIDLVSRAMSDLITFGKAILPPNPEDPDPVMYVLSPKEWLDLVLTYMEYQEREEQRLVEKFTALETHDVIWILQDEETPQLSSGNGNGHKSGS